MRLGLRLALDGRQLLGGIVAPVTPVLTWTSGTAAYDPSFSMTQLAQADVAELQIDDNSDFSSIYGSDTNTIDAAEAAGGSLTFPAIPTLLGSTTYYARARYTRGGVASAWSATVSKVMDATASAYLSDNFTGTNGQLIDARTGWVAGGASTQANMATVSSNDALFTYRPDNDTAVKPLGAPVHNVGVNKMYVQAKGGGGEFRLIIASDLAMSNMIVCWFDTNFFRMTEYVAGVKGYSIAQNPSLTISGVWLGIRYDKATEIPTVYSGDFEAGTHTDLYTFPFPGTGNEPNGFKSSGTYVGLMGNSAQDQTITDFKAGTY